jgi:hypothetical protein
MASQNPATIPLPPSIPGTPGVPADTESTTSHRDRQHDTEVCEAFKPAITKETIVPVEKLEETVAIDREVHQDHYQTRVQPIEDKVREAERHEHNVLPVENREQRHGKDAEIKRKLELEVYDSQMKSRRFLY